MTEWQRGGTMRGKVNKRNCVQRRKEASLTTLNNGMVKQKSRGLGGGRRGKKKASFLQGGSVYGK